MHGVGYKSNRLLNQFFQSSVQIKPGLFWFYFVLKWLASGNSKSHFTNLPTHFFPFPVKPTLHEQLWEPMVFAHSALASHTGIVELHSSTSDKRIVCGRFKSKKEGIRWIITRSWIHQTNCFRREPKFYSVRPHQEAKFPLPYSLNFVTIKL